MKKQSIIIGAVVLVLLVFLFFKYIYGWKELRRNTDTPKEFVNGKTTDRSIYATDSLNAIENLQNKLSKREDFFDKKAYNDSTILIVDTILYSPDFKKIAILLITKNLTSRQLIPDKNHKYYYDATCYLGLRENTIDLLKWVGPVFTNATDSKSISEDIREACFRTFATPDTTDVYEYNMNDVRFWNSAIWKGWH